MIQETKTLQSIYVGLDISKQEIEICAINNEGKSLLTFTTSNTRIGFHRLIEKLMHYDEPTFGVESTGPYSGNIIQFLKRINAQIVLTNPFQISRLRDVFSKSVKTDPIDAYVIAQALRMNFLKNSQKSDIYVFMQDLLERYYDLTDRRTALANQLRSNLIETFPEFDKCFATIYCHTALVLLNQYQTAKDLLAAGEENILQTVRVNKGRIMRKQLKSLLHEASHSSGWKTSKYHKFILRSQIRELQIVNREIEELDEVLDDYSLQFTEEIDLLESVPGVGKKISYQFLAIIGDYQRFDPDGDGSGAKRLSSYLGYGMKEYSSGAKSYRLGISKRGNSRLRGMMYMAALNAIRRDEELRIWFDRYKGRHGSGKKGVVAVGHILLRRCYGVLKSRSKYNPNIASGKIKSADIAPSP